MGDFRLSRLGSHTWFGDLVCRVEPNDLPVQVATFKCFSTDACEALVTDRCRLELLRVSIDGSTRTPIVMDLRSSVVRSTPWLVVGGILPVPVVSGFLLQVDFGPTDEWSIWAAVSPGSDRLTVELRAVVEHCCGYPSLQRGFLEGKPT